MKQITLKGERQNNTTEGKWVKYEQGSDYNLLRNSLQGYYTGWCTAAGENFAKEQLANGDFYVYYTMDENNEPKVPRIAIRMDGKDTIGEIRGIADNQNMEPEMMPILNEKLEEFPDKDRYQKKEYDMQYLTSIDRKVKKGIELSVDELRFLYEIDSEIEGFGYRKDPRIKEIKSNRDKYEDLAKIFNCTKDEISDDKNDVLSGKKLVYFHGDLDLEELTTAEGLVLPEKIGGYLDLRGLTSAEGLVLPKEIGGTLYLNSLTSAEGLVFPKEIGEALYLNSLTSAENLILPEKLGSDLGLNSLTSAASLIMPKEIGGTLYLNSLISAESLVMPKKIGGTLHLNSLISAEGLVLPEEIGVTLRLNSLTSAEGLVLPEKINNSLCLDSLTSAEGLVMPKEIGGTLHLNSLTSAENLILPEELGGDLWLNSLTSADGLVMPKEIGGTLYLEGLTTVDGLMLPENFDLDNLIIDESLEEEIMPNPNKYYRHPEITQNDILNNSKTEVHKTR